MTTLTAAAAAAVRRRCRICKRPEGHGHKMSCDYARYPSRHPNGPVWEAAPGPAYDEHWEGYVLGSDETHRYLWLWHGFNIRLIALPHGDEGQFGYDHGWCYPRDPSGVEAAFAAWDPATQDEPAGWHKRPTHPPRRAPHRDQDPQYNRPRCVHGCYIAEGCRTLNCPDAPDRDSGQARGNGHDR